MNAKLLVALTIGAMLFSASAALATPIAVNNHSFEEAGLAAGGWSDSIDVQDGAGGDPDYWVDDPLNSNDGGFAEHILGFSADGTQHLGVNSGNDIVQTLAGVSLVPNMRYVLTVAVGHRAAQQAGNTESTFGLDVGGTPVGRTVADVTGNPDLSFQDFRFVYFTDATPPAGDIGIALGRGGDSGRAHYDNVRLDLLEIPEPATLMLLGLGGLGLGCALKRRRTQ